MLTIENVNQCQARIKVFGVGGGGCNAVNRMVEMNLAGIDFIAANTDMQALANARAPSLIQLGANLTRGLGAGGNPDIGREAAIEDEETIRMHIEDSDMVFITAGMGGGTGTGGAPVVARLAKEMGALTIAVVTKPFRFEGKRRSLIAEAGIRELEEFVDTLIIIPNQKLLQTVERNTTLDEAFKLADDVLCQAVQGISDLITIPGLINLDFADVKAIMSGMGKALMGTGFGEGESKADMAVQRAISSPLLDDMTVEGARGILINITGGDDLTLMELESALDIVHSTADADANIIFGAVLDTSYHNRVKATVIATGFDASDGRRRAPFPSHTTFSSTPNMSSVRPVENHRRSPSVRESIRPAATTRKPEHPTSPPAYPAIATPAAMHSETKPQTGRSDPPIQTDSPATPLAETLPKHPAESPEDTVSMVTTQEIFVAEQESIEHGREMEEPAEIDTALEDTSPGHTATAPEPAAEPETENQTEPDVTPPLPEAPRRQALSKELELTERPSSPPIIDRPELDLNQPNNMLPFSPNIPTYQRKDLSSGSFKRNSPTDGKDIAVDSSNYMVPAFLRRKAD